MKRILAILIMSALFLALFTGNILAAEKTAEKKAPATAKTGGTDMTGKVGIGAGGNGFGLRYWVTDTFGLDGNFGFVFGEDNTEFELGGKGVFVIKKTENLRFLGLAGLNLDLVSIESTTLGVKTEISTNTFNIGGGVGVEYFLHELPNLSFGAFVTGIGINFISAETTVGGISSSDSTTTFSTNPGLGLEIRYYFK